MASGGGLISQDTYFLEPSPYTTVTAPGDARNSITATAYQHRDGSIYIAAGRGYTPNGMVTPHLAAPGVNVKVPLVRGGFGTRSGTSISAAQTAGIAALLFEWAIIRDNQPFFYRKQREILSAERGKKRGKHAVSKPGVGVWKGGSVSYV